MTYDKVEDKELYWKALEAEYLAVAAARAEDRRKQGEEDAGEDERGEKQGGHQRGKAQGEGSGIGAANCNSQGGGQQQLRHEGQQVQALSGGSGK